LLPLFVLHGLNIKIIPDFAAVQNSAMENPGLPCKADKILVGFYRATPSGQILLSQNSGLRI